MLLSEDDVDAGDLASAQARVEGLFKAWPYESDGWLVEGPKAVNVGSPAAYYGLRMLEDIVAAGPLEPAPSRPCGSSASGSAAKSSPGKILGAAGSFTNGLPRGAASLSVQGS